MANTYVWTTLNRDNHGELPVSRMRAEVARYLGGSIPSTMTTGTVFLAGVAELLTRLRGAPSYVWAGLGGAAESIARERVIKEFLARVSGVDTDLTVEAMIYGALAEALRQQRGLAPYDWSDIEQREVEEVAISRAVTEALGFLGGAISDEMTFTDLLYAAVAELAARYSAPAPASVVVTPETASGIEGSTVQLAASVRDANGNVMAGETVTWSSSNTAVATVNSTGLVTFVAAGTATVTATSTTNPALSDSCAVTVSQDTTPAEVVVTPETASVNEGSTVQLSAEVRNASGDVLSGETVTWSSSNTAVATVNSTGLVTGVAQGSATITARSTTNTSLADTCALTVTVAPTGLPATLNANRFQGDDFTSYTDTADFNTKLDAGTTVGAFSAVESDHHAIDTAVLFNGHQTLRKDFPGGSNSAPYLVHNLSGTRQNIWSRAVVRFGPGWTNEGDGGAGSAGYKFAGAGWIDRENRMTIEIVGPEWQAAIGSDPVGGTQRSPSYQPDGRAEMVDSEWSDGVWYESILLIEDTVWNGIAGKRVRQWWGPHGTKPGLRQDSRVDDAGGVSPAVRSMEWGMNYNRTRLADQNLTMYYGLVECLDASVHADPYGLIDEGAVSYAHKWDAAELSLTDGAAVTSWPSSGTRNRAMSAAAGEEPVFRATVTGLNNKPGVEFGGTKRMTYAGGENQHMRHRLHTWVLRLNSLPAAGAAGRLHDSSGAVFYVTDAGAIAIDHKRVTTTGAWTTQTGLLAAGTSYIIEVLYDSWDDANDPRVWVNGVEATVTRNIAPSGLPTDESTVSVGNRPGGDRPLPATFAFIGELTSWPSAADQTVERERLAALYGIVV